MFASVILIYALPFIAGGLMLAYDCKGKVVTQVLTLLLSSGFFAAGIYLLHAGK